MWKQACFSSFLCPALSWMLRQMEKAAQLQPNPSLYMVEQVDVEENYWYKL